MPIWDKIMGALAILGVVAAVILILLSGTEKNELIQGLPNGVMTLIQDSMDHAPEMYRESAERILMLDQMLPYGRIGMVALLVAAPMLLFPRFMWFLGTLKYRLFYGWETPASDFVQTFRRLVTYLLFALGLLSTLWGWILYL